MIWICSDKKPGHVFEHPTENGLCPLCSKVDDISFLYKENLEPHNPPEKIKTSIEIFNETVIKGDKYMAKGMYYDAKQTYIVARNMGIENESLDIKIQTAHEKDLEAHVKAINEEKPVADDLKELGLCIILLDASGSMRSPAFKNNPLTKTRMIARAAAQGIFSLKSNEYKEFAYIAIYKFDHKIGPPIIMKSIANIISEYQSVTKFEDFLHDHLNSDDMGGQTNINDSLTKAYELARKFLNYEIHAFRKVFGGEDYPIKKQRVINQKTIEQHLTSNVRVLLFTDGLQYYNGSALPIDNPFKNGGNLENFDLLLGAFIGPEEEEEFEDDGRKELQVVLGQCPIHNEKQFFLIDHPDKLFTLEGLFQMASGSSGFCPKCLENSGNIPTKIPNNPFDDLFEKKSWQS